MIGDLTSSTISKDYQRTKNKEREKGGKGNMRLQIIVGDLTFPCVRMTMISVSEKE